MTDTGTNRLTTNEVAELLGIKRQTVYAYVSRGILHREMAMDGRTSLFDRVEVEELRLGRNPERDGEMRTIIATRLTRVSDEGIWIRGTDLIGAVSDGAGFTDIADLLWRSPEEESWPTAAATDVIRSASAAQPPLDQFRVLVAEESSADPLRHDLSARSVRAAGRRAIMAMVGGLQTQGVAKQGVPAHEQPVVSSIAGLVWRRLTAAAPSDAQRRAVDMALALLAKP